jgi:flavodoxin
MMNTETSTSKSTKRAIVIFDSRYGNTEKIARSFEEGLKRSGIATVCINSNEVSRESLKEYDLIAVGAPTEWLMASKPMKRFLENLKGVDLSGKFGFAFDTKLGRRLSGSAAKSIEKELKNLGLNLIAQHESAIVFGTGSSMSSMTLKGGEENRFEKIGLQVGTNLVARREMISA